ncbi:hypothetical protein ACTXG7_18285 [Mycolicibacterium sp. Dal123E01]|uniref:hypothetical protein n=1 Tax=Mycolicibacterium sp. Dal123E01 TaxID=3457578 RepID=UPI00403ECD8B
MESGADQEYWCDEDRVLIRLCDSLHDSCNVDDGLWDSLTRYRSEEAIIELLMLAGYYRMVSYLVNGLRLPLEPNTPQFNDFAAGSTSGRQSRWSAGE